MPVSETKRVRRQPEATRALILDATETLMVAEGYAAVTSRRLAGEAGIAAALIHYYYPTIDDVFVALHRRMTDRQLERIAEVLATADPLSALWEFQCGWTQSALATEFFALANHRKAIARIVVQRTEEAREVQARAIAAALDPAIAEAAGLSPVALVTMIVAIARTLANEQSVGITRGHDEVRAFMRLALGRIRTPERP